MELSPSSITFATLSFSGALLIINFLILSYFYLKLAKNKDKDNKFFLYFKRFTMFFAIFTVIMATPILLFSRSSFAIGMGYLIGHIFLYIACAYLARIWLFIAKPSFDSKNIFRMYLILGLAVTILNIYYFNYPTINEHGIVLWNAERPVAIAIIAILMSTLLPAAIAFLRESIKQPKQRKRFALIGLSFIAIIVGGPLHDVAQTVKSYLVADMVTISGFLLMFWGVVSGAKNVIDKD